jgi:hypothetical protein
MARTLRIEFVGALYHVTARGNAEANIYGDDDDQQKTKLGARLRFLLWQCGARLYDLSAH